MLTIQMHHDTDEPAELDESVARLTALRSVTRMCLSKLGVGRSGPIEGLDLASEPAWVYLDLGPQDVEPTLSLCGDRIKKSQAILA